MDASTLRIQFENKNYLKFVQSLLDNEFEFTRRREGEYEQWLMVVELTLTDDFWARSWKLRQLLEAHEGWRGVGPWCDLRHSHGPTTSVVNKFDSRNAMWKCVERGCSFSVPQKGSPFMTMRDFLTESAKRQTPKKSFAEQLIERRGLPFLNAWVDKPKEPSRAQVVHELAAQNQITVEQARQLMEMPPLTIIDGTYPVQEPPKPHPELWSLLNEYLPRLNDTRTVLEKAEAMRGQMTEHEKQQRWKHNEPNPVGQIPREPKKGEEIPMWKPLTPEEQEKRRDKLFRNELLGQYVPIDTETTTGRLSVSGRRRDRGDHLFKIAAMESQQVFSKRLEDFPTPREAYEHMKTGGVVDVGCSYFMGMDYGTLEKTTAAIYALSIGEGDGIVMSSGKKFHQAMAHVLPTDIHKRALRQTMRFPIQSGAADVSTAMRQEAKKMNFAQMYGAPGYSYTTPSESGQEMKIHAELDRAEKFAELKDNVEKLSDIVEEQNRLIEKLRGELDANAKKRERGQTINEGYTKTLDTIFCFFAGINMQDHSVAEQRKFLELMREFKNLMLELKGKA